MKQFRGAGLLCMTLLAIAGGQAWAVQGASAGSKAQDTQWLELLPENDYAALNWD